MRALPPALLERLFDRSSRRLLYAQVWEDPHVDRQALNLAGARVLSIASAGCNVLAYLADGPASVLAVDRNWPHLALTRLKLAALEHLPDYEAFFRFFGVASAPGNVAAYEQHIRPHLDGCSRAFWDARDVLGRPRISLFERNFYAHCASARLLRLLGLLVRLHGGQWRAALAATTPGEQRRVYDSWRRVWRSPLLRLLTDRSAFWFNAGVAPRQLDAVRQAGGGDLLAWLQSRVRHVVCDFPIADNPFVWQMAALRYDVASRRAIPAYLEPEAYQAARPLAGRVRTQLGDVTGVLAEQPDGAFDCCSLMDVFDWLSPAQAAELWRQLDRACAPGARVVYRCGGLEGSIALPAEVAGRWRAVAELSRRLTAEERTGLYGSVQLLVKSAGRSSPTAVGEAR